MEAWWESCSKFKENKAIVKLYNEDDSLKDSIVVPTIKYPLNGKYEVFHYKNTKIVTNEEVLKIFDAQEYKIGKCYQNTARMVSALKSAGYNVKSYVGWLFTESSDYPIHHCWAVLNGESVIDLCDDYTQMLGGANGEHFKNARNRGELEELVADFYAAARNVRHSIRCSPVGMPTSIFLYVGCECEPDAGRVIYQQLMRQFPDHECERNCDSSGMNSLQRHLNKRGLF